LGTCPCGVTRYDAGVDEDVLGLRMRDRTYDYRGEDEAREHEAGLVPQVRVL
jgi:hypothetical protein